MLAFGSGELLLAESALVGSWELLFLVGMDVEIAGVGNAAVVPISLVDGLAGCDGGIEATFDEGGFLCASDFNPNEGLLGIPLTKVCSAERTFCATVALCCGAAGCVAEGG